MEMSKGNITRIINESNKALEKHGFVIKRAYECAEFTNVYFSQAGNLKDNMFVIRFERNKGIVTVEKVSGGNITGLMALSPENNTEVIQLITIILTGYIRNNGPISAKITQTKNGCTQLKRIVTPDGYYADLYTNVVKAAMVFGLLKVRNAGLGANKAIIVKRGTFANIGCVLNPSYKWYHGGWYIDRLKEEGYLI